MMTFKWLTGVLKERKGERKREREKEKEREKKEKKRLFEPKVIGLEFPFLPFLSSYLTLKTEDLTHINLCI